MAKIGVTIVIGTRPEAIKMAPVFLKFQESSFINIRLITTGQHLEMVNQILDFFKISPNLHLNIMKKSQTLEYLTTAIMLGVMEDLKKNSANLLLVQGDTTSALAASLGAFYSKVPIGHVEAGLRTNDIFNPYPEEANRRLISQIASLHFAPTNKAEKNLHSSKISGRIVNTGNTVIDALKIASKYKYRSNLFDDINSENIILATIHRRENWQKLEKIATGIKKVLDKNKNSFLLLPLHRNPIVREPIQKILGNHERAFLTEPLEYTDLITALKLCKLVLTDSGGIQEEAPAFSKPVLILRENTERMESVDAGVAKLIGTDSERISEEVSKILNCKNEYTKMSKAISPYGDGNSSERILN